jgi:hypothetical protein
MRYPMKRGFEQRDIGAGFREDLGSHTSAGSRSDDTNIVDFSFSDDLHSQTLPGSGATQRVVYGRTYVVAGL